LKKVKMSQKISRTDTKRRKRNSRLITFGWIAGIAVLIIVLLYKERSDWLYVLATLGLTALLVIVALTDLHGERQGVDEAALGDDSAAIGSSIAATATPIATTAPSDWRGAKGRKTRRK
jgi:NADH:ubiquinone oxidoreductase subunit 2 (subunit N)